jgi:glucose-6-phosphate 1-dehydrogenase
VPSADDPFSVVIFGASGDLTRRKLIPALWSLYASRTLPEPFAIVGTARTEMSDAEFKTRMREAVFEFARIKPPSEAVWNRFAAAITYVVGDPARAELYADLGRTLGEI